MRRRGCKASGGCDAVAGRADEPSRRMSGRWKEDAVTADAVEEETRPSGGGVRGSDTEGEESGVRWLWHKGVQRRERAEDAEGGTGSSEGFGNVFFFVEAGAPRAMPRRGNGDDEEAWTNRGRGGVAAEQ